MCPLVRRGLAAAAGALLAMSSVAVLRAAPDEAMGQRRAPSPSLDVGVPATVTLTAPAVLTVGQVAGRVRVDVVDAAGLPVTDGTTVTLSVGDGDLAPAEGTTTAGTLTATLTSSTKAGLVELTAQAGAAAAVAQVEFVAAPPAGLQLYAPAFGRAGELLHVAVGVQDEYGNATGDGGVVAWESALGISDPMFSIVKEGSAISTIHNVTAGIDFITATLASLQLTTSATIVYAPGPAATLLVAVSPRRIPVGGQADVLITAADVFGNLVTDELTVLLTATGGDLSPVSVRLRQGTGKTVLRAGGTPGEFQVAATAAGIVGTADVSLRPADLAMEIGLRGPRGLLPENQVHPGEPVWVDLIVANADLATARSVVLGVVVPDAMRPGRATSNSSIHERTSGPPGLIEDPPEGHSAMFWDLPDVAYGQSVVVTVPGSFDPDRPWTGVDTFYVRGAANSRTVEASGSDLARGRAVPVHSTDLYLTSELDSAQSQLRPGGMAVFDIRFGNHYRVTELQQVRITDTLPVGLAFDRWQAGPATPDIRAAFPFERDSRDLVWDLPVDFGASGSLRLWLAIDESVPPDGALRNDVSIGSDVLDVGPENNVSSAAFALRGVNLAATIQTAAEAAVLDHVAAHIVVRNLSPQDPASAVKVISRPPEGARVISRSAGGVLGPDGSITWEAESLGQGGRLEFDVVVEVPEASTLGSLLRHSVASSSRETDSLPVDNESLATTLIVAGPPASAELQPPGPARACGLVPVPLSLRVTDRSGNPARDGTAVTWSSTSGSVVDPTATQDGQATALWWPGRAAGQAVLAAVAGEARAEQAVEVAPSMFAGLAISLRPRIAPASGQVQVTVNALDGCSQPAADGIPVVLHAARGSFGAGGAEITMATRGGRVATTLNVGDVFGPLRVRAENGDVVGEAIVSVVPPGEEPPDETPPPTLWLPFVMGRQRR